MQTGHAPGSERALVVGPDRVIAARIFGHDLAGGHVTSYADVAREIDLDHVQLLCLVASSGVHDLLGRIAAPEVLLLGATDDPTGRDELLAALDVRTDLRPDELTQDGTALVVRLAPAARGRTSARVVRELRRLHAAPSRSLVRRAVGRLRRLSR